MCLIKEIKPKYEVIYLDQRSYEILGYRQNFVNFRKIIFLGPKYQFLRIWAQTFSKSNVKFEITTFEIGYKQNFVKIRKLILFGPKCPNLGIWARNFRKNNVRFEISTFEIGYTHYFVKN